MKKLLFLLSILLINTAEIPAIEITGSVFDEQGNPIAGVTILEKSTKNSVVSDLQGHYLIAVSGENSILNFSFVGYESKEEKVGKRQKIDVVLTAAITQLQEVVTTGYGHKSKRMVSEPASYDMRASGAISFNYEPEVMHNTEAYDGIEENIFHRSLDKPLSTFSIDVDVASYSNMRRFLNMGQLPPKDAVRIEEMINYFNYNYEGPKNEDPFAIHTSVTQAPWNEQHLIAHIGLQGRKIEAKNLPASNLVFLVDVSGSMNSPNKLPLLKSSLKMLVNEMRPQDKVSIVVYAGAAGLVLSPTDGNDKQKIISSLENLAAGGSTAGGAGIQLAYKVAKEQFVVGGNNRVILATDGDFNVGASSNGEMQRVIEEKREDGIFLTVLGFGMGNYKDSKMEILADKGNGNYAYIDNIQEAKKVLITEFGGTLFTIAKDVKIQVEFNPVVVQAYRLIGYENRKLRDEDFNDDTKDAGELGSGHTVTALYEIIPVGVNSSFTKSIDPLKYQSGEVTNTRNTNELLTVKFRYKEPDGHVSKLITRTLSMDDKDRNNENLHWACAVAGFGMVLRHSEFKGDMDYNKVLTLARNAKGNDDFGYRTEFIKLVEVASRLQ